MKFHPVISIILGIIASFALHFISLSLFTYGLVAAVPSIFSYIFGGFIATYFAKKKTIQYALYEGIFIMLIIVILELLASSDIYTSFIYGVLIILLAIIGGMIGLLIDKNYNGFNPYLAVLAGSFIGTSCIGITSILGYNPDSLHLGVIDIVGGILSFMIGGFLSTILAKERNILDGLCTGVILLLIITISSWLIFHKPIIIHILEFIIYFVSAVIGGYLAIKITEHQQNLNKESL